MTMDYLVNKIYEYDKSSNNIIELFKSRFVKKSLTESFESKITKFYEELLFVSNNFGLGKDISLDIVYDGPTPERVFTINVPYNLNFDDKYYFSDQIVDYMADFSRKENMFDFFKNAYILIK